MTRRKEIEAPPKDELVRLRSHGKSRDEIAKHYGVSLSRVKRWISELGVETSNEPKKTHHSARTKAAKRRAIDGGDDGLTLLEQTRIILGDRVSEDFRGYLLDGRPIRVDALVRAAGLKLKDV